VRTRERARLPAGSGSRSPVESRASKQPRLAEPVNRARGRTALNEHHSAGLGRDLSATGPPKEGPRESRIAVTILTACGKVKFANVFEPLQKRTRSQDPDCPFALEVAAALPVLRRPQAFSASREADGEARPQQKARCSRRRGCSGRRLYDGEARLQRKARWLRNLSPRLASSRARSRVRRQTFQRPLHQLPYLTEQPYASVSFTETAFFCSTSDRTTSMWRTRVPDLGDSASPSGELSGAPR
jgi:hypothetical protein